ncbi:hypothetical protein B0J14DRAFT_653740 [Halenospora varia]|nr:hypothetical protein B0J14DRAFT_653740 [Halenospora varia]
MEPYIELFHSNRILEELINPAAKFLSETYGVWGHLAEENMGGAVKQGFRIRISPSLLKAKLLTPSAHNTYVRITDPTTHTLLGNVFATRWTTPENADVLWITQLVVKKEDRNQGLATQMLQALKKSMDMEEKKDYKVGVLSSSPWTICAVLSVFGLGVRITGHIIHSMRENVRVMESCPAEYVRTATHKGTLGRLLERKRGEKGVVSCADTGFWIDHVEPKEALRVLEGKGVEWPFGVLWNGCEFLDVLEVRSWSL